MRAPVHDHDACRGAGRGDARGRPSDDPRPGSRDVLPPARRSLRRRLVPARTAARGTGRYPPARQRSGPWHARRQPARRAPGHAVPAALDAGALRGAVGRRASAHAGPRHDPARLHAQRDVLVHARWVPGPRADRVGQGRVGRRGDLADPRRWRRTAHGRLDHRWRARLRHPRDGHRPIRARADLTRLRPRPGCAQLRRGLRPGPSAPAARGRPAATHRAVPRTARGTGRRILRGQGLGARPVVRHESGRPRGGPVRLGGASSGPRPPRPNTARPARRAGCSI